MQKSQPTIVLVWEQQMMRRASNWSLKMRAGFVASACGAMCGWWCGGGCVGTVPVPVAAAVEAS